MKQYQYLKINFQLKDWKLLIIDFVANAVVDDVDAVDVVFDIVVGVVVMNVIEELDNIDFKSLTIETIVVLVAEFHNNENQLYDKKNIKNNTNKPIPMLKIRSLKFQFTLQMGDGAIWKEMLTTPQRYSSPHIEISC
ncbi:hypothetical protein H8356DRAFT_1437483 [Neocallimastix lanati (nom. inval.)]|nr:hypothetical protein H8356DRAFT_1437478 [Neocallimastix sp. JGI-2020a]KAG4082783.1 hypothetical protein H8356DRAFT_1437483 [Neocallimastix sp. JGI-2020a]